MYYTAINLPQVWYRGVAAAVTTGRCWPELTTAAGMLACHLVGAVCYATHWPQRAFPATFDHVVSARGHACAWRGWAGWAGPGGTRYDIYCCEMGWWAALC